MTRWLLVLCLMVSIGLHTVVIQSAAWAGMLVSYSLEKGSMLQAVGDTFDGAHPCPLCKLAQKTKEKSPTPSGTTTGPDQGQLKLHLIAEDVVSFVFAPPPLREFHTAADKQADTRATTPDVPPPKRVHLA